MPELWVSELSTINTKDTWLWGNKSVNLAMSLRFNCWIPRSYCLSTYFYDDYCTNGELTNEYMLNECFCVMLNESRSKKLIVRSSAACEDLLSDSFAGIFESIGCICNYQSFIKAIIACFNSTSSERTQLYCQTKKLNHRKIKMAILVQEQVDAVVSGVLFTRSPFSNREIPLVELCYGGSNDLLKGSSLGNSYELTGRHDFVVKSEVADISHSLLSLVLSLLYELADKLQITFDIVNIEWLWDGNTLFVTQVRSAIKNILEENDDSVYYKLNAMKMFVQLNLFDKPVIFIEGNDIDEIKLAISKVVFGETIKIIRFADKGKLGLPKHFVITDAEALSAVDKSWNKGRSLIIYDEIDICDSFEVYIDYHRGVTIIEHIPGVWDSDNTLMPDIIVLKESVITLYRYNRYRYAKFDSHNSVSYRKIEPILNGDFKHLLVFIRDAMNKIRKTTTKNCFNCHFVRDMSGKTFFLNLRNIQSFNLSFIDSKYFKEITKVEQISQYKNSVPVLLNFNIARGNEIDLLRFSQYFKGRVCCLKFGILSHPAIVLRELGALTYPYIDDKNYSVESLDN